MRLPLPCLLFACFALSAGPAAGQSVPPKYEFRGTWVATVFNLDWPVRGGHPDAQKRDLEDQLDALKAAGLNAVFFQIRPEGDAFYDSPYEPWSYWLTGRQGQAPSPYFDPLAFAIEAAHERGMELHAWFNPYRAVADTDRYTIASEHASEEHPEWMLSFGDLKLFDPGLPEVRAYIVQVIMDVVRRYDIDGVHFDDYFYPYPPNQIGAQDEDTYAAHSRGIGNIGDWRRDNINLLVAAVHDSVAAAKPLVKFGISPFGIWKNGVPAGTTGTDAYSVTFSDAVAWLLDQTVDYITPQLYWPFGGGQDYGKLAPWWAGQAFGRHFYPGHGLYRSDATTFGNTLISADEIPNQIRFNREDPFTHGSVFYRAKNITTYASKGFADTLAQDLYRYPALTPIMDWKDQTAPGPPRTFTFAWTGTGAYEVTLSWEHPAAAAGQAAAERYAVYRVNASQPPSFASIKDDARNLLAITGNTEWTDVPGLAEDPFHYYVTAVSGNSVERAADNVVSVEGRPVAVERESPQTFALHQNYPNPFNPLTTIRYELAAPGRVSLRVFDAMGRLVQTLVADEAQGLGLHEARWHGQDAAGRTVASGTYFYRLDVDGRRVTRAMVLLR